MGLKLRSQIFALLFCLFTTTVLVLGYLNMTLLFDAMQAQGEERGALLASHVVSGLERTPALRPSSEGYSALGLRQRFAPGGEAFRSLQEIRNLRALQVLTPQGSVLYSFGPPETRYELSRKMLAVAVTTGHPDFSLWMYNSPQDREGQPVEARTVLLPYAMTFESYHPILANKQVVAVYHLSLQVYDIPQRLRVTLVGNLLVSGVFVLTAFIAVSAWTSRAISRPMELVLRAQQQIGKGDFTANVQLESPSTNEIVRIIASFNRMSADLRRFRKELEIKTQRLENINLEYQRLNESLKTEVDAKTRDLQEFFGVITHDLKVPLAAIQGYTDLLERARDGGLAPKQARYLRGIGVATNHLLGLTRNMMEAVAYDAGKIRYFLKDFDLEVVADEVVAQLAGAMDEKGVRFEKDLPQDCREVRGDPSKIAQVLINLLTNALKFSTAGGTIALVVSPRERHVEVQVRDQGAGIPSEHLPYLFEKFSQFHTVEGSSSSMGLGLYIVGRIVEGHGQAITVESVPGEGSSFTFGLERSGLPTQEVGEAEDLD